MSDETFTKIAGKLLTGVRDLVDWGIEEGHTTQEKLRLTVQARRETAAKLIEAGMSQRAAAKALGVGKGTIHRDLTQKGAESAPERGATKAERRAERELELASKQMALPDKRYGVIAADPEWRFEPYSRDTGMDRAADNHYPTSATEIIAARPVQEIAAEDCVLFLWATVPMLEDAMEVLKAWGFKYRSHAIWDKVHIGTGYWFRNRHELLLVGTKGDIPAPAMGDQFASVMTIARKEHSAKPEQFLELIEQYFPTLPKIELNRRGPPRLGWDAWGNEAETAPVEQAAE
jgi:N6-adenosine-specific RNA methylase IME4